MNDVDYPPVRAMVREAAEALEEPFSNAEIRDFVLARWPDTNEDTLGCQIIVCTVNQRARVNWSENRRPRVADDPRYDFLYRIGRGKRVVYDAETRGTWRIARSADGDPTVVCDDDVPPVKEEPREASTPILQSQIDAANYLFKRIKTWVACERAFERLRDEMPGFDLPTSLLKAAAINDLYWAGVFGIWRMARHISEVACTLPKNPVEAVRKIARLPADGEEKGRTHRSFASKFCHFFIDSERFPIYDLYCRNMVAHHLGRDQLQRDPKNRYRAFKANVDRLRELSRLSVSYRELDRYLWLAGQYHEWLDKGDKGQINSEVRELFADLSPDIQDALQALVTYAEMTE
ncbi:MAG: hypothetical protein KAW89_05625 [Armatimonadetes bacterium]|nr:hypothetical protein [Armatimonadota bacterium]